MDNSKPRALILEDEPLIAMDLETTLSEAGFDVSTVGACSEASDWLDVWRPDIVIVDVELRDGPSHTIAQQLYDHGIPFVVHSGDVAGALSGTPYERGIWLSKPSMPENLLAAIRQATSALQQP